MRRINTIKNRLELNLKPYLKYIFIIFLLNIIVYANTLPNKLFFDDEELVYKNAYVQNLSYFPKYFSENMIAGAGKTSNMYRPILLFSFAVDFFIWKNNPIGYHLTSILLHFFNGVLILIILDKLFKSKFIAFTSVLFFISHPVQTEAITYVSGRTDPLFSFFLLCLIFLFLNIIENTVNNIFIFFLMLILFIFSLLSKEAAIVAPFTLLLIYFIHIEREKRDYFYLTKIMFPFLIIDFLYIFLRLTILNFSNTLNFYSQQNLYSNNIIVRFFTFTSSFFNYIYITFFPKELVMFRNTQIINFFFSPTVIAFLIFIFVSVIFIFKNFSKKRIFAFSFFWFFITIFPSSGFIPINNIMAEHYLYLPSISVFTIIAYFTHQLSIRGANERTIVYILLTIMVIILSARTMLRNQDWNNPITFYTKSIKQSPWHIPMRHNLAMTYSDIGQLDKAIIEYKNIISTNDVYPHTHHNLANIYKEQGKYKEAENEYKEAISLDPNFQFSYFGLIELYIKTGEKEKLEKIQDYISLHFKNKDF